MKPYIIYQVMKADLLERARRPSFLAMCISAMFLAFFSVPDVEAPFVSICMEPGIFRQGSNASWIPIQTMGRSYTVYRRGRCGCPAHRAAMWIWRAG